MYKVIKNKKKTVKAYCLGTDHPVIAKLIEEGKIVPVDKETYEIFSLEVLNSGAKHGALAHAGDYVKIDSGGYPYHNTAQFFAENHIRIKGITDGDEYYQKNKPLAAWDWKEPMCREIEYLIKEKGLILDEEHPESYYTAPLFGTIEVQKNDAVLVFYSITYDENGEITDADYNLIDRLEFEKTYSRY